MYQRYDFSKFEVMVEVFFDLKACPSILCSIIIMVYEYTVKRVDTKHQKQKDCRVFCCL